METPEFDKLIERIKLAFEIAKRGENKEKEALEPQIQDKLN